HDGALMLGGETARTLPVRAGGPVLPFHVLLVQERCPRARLEHPAQEVRKRRGVTLGGRPEVDVHASQPGGEASARRAISGWASRASRGALRASCGAWLYFAVACARLPQPNFLRIRRTWFLTVNGLMLSAKPISALVLPLHIASRTSCSRVLTSSQSSPSFSAVESAKRGAATLRKAASICVTSRSTRSLQRSLDWRLVNERECRAI